MNIWQKIILDDRADADVSVSLPASERPEPTLPTSEPIAEKQV